MMIGANKIFFVKIVLKPFQRCNDIQHNDSQYNNTQCNNKKHYTIHNGNQYYGIYHNDTSHNNKNMT